MSKLAFVSVLGLVASAVAPEIASAQPTPATNSEPAAAAPAGAASPAPASPSATETTSTTSTTSPAADTAEASKKPEPKPLFWRGSTFDWETFATSTEFGIGADTIGLDNNYVGMLFSLSPNVYVLDLPKDKINISATLAAIIELSNTSYTDQLHELMLRDTPLTATYTRTLYQSKDKEWETKGKVTAGLIFPTSPISYHEGKYLTTSLGVGVSQKFKLLGKDAAGLNDLTVGARFSWNHLFSRTYNPTDESLGRLRQDATSQTVQSDILSFNSFDVDQLIPSVSVDLPLYKDLSLSVAGRLIGRFKHDFKSTGCDVATLTGCAQAQSPDNHTTYSTLTLFDASLTQSILGLVDVTVGYYNLADGLQENGQLRNPFYSPDAEFYASLTANIDVIYSKASGREPVDLPGRATKTALSGTAPSTTAFANPATRMPSF